MIRKYWCALYSTSAFVCMRCKCAYHWRIPCLCVSACVLWNSLNKIFTTAEREIRFFYRRLHRNRSFLLSSPLSHYFLFHFKLQMLSHFILQNNFNVLFFVCVWDFFLHKFVCSDGMLNSIPYAWKHLKNPTKLRHNNTFYSSPLSVCLCCCLNGMQENNSNAHKTFFFS